MGRRPKNAEKSHQKEIVNPSVEGREAALATKSRSLATLTEKTGSSMPTQEANQSNGQAKRIVNKTASAIRRSGRFQKAVMATENHCIQQIIEEIVASESEKEDEPINEEHPEHAVDRKEIHEKIDYVVELLQEQQRAINELNAKRNGVGECSGATEVTFKSLYFDSQKKIEALKEENNQLMKKLEYANGKIEIYERGDHVSYGMLEKMKDVLFCANGARAAETGANGPTIAAEGALESKNPKRKRGPK